LLDQLRALDELQKVDSLVREIELELAEIPRKVKELRGDVDRVRELLDRERAELAGAEKMRRDAEHEVQAHQEMLAKARQKASAVTKTREHDAAMREIEAMRKAVGDRQEDALRLMGAIEQFKASIAQHEEEFGKIRQVLEGEEAEARARMTELTAKKSAHDEARMDAVRKLRPDVLRKYETIRQRRGVAISDVVAGQCTGCHMQLPPQLYNIILRIETLEICPNCNRILYYRGEKREPTGTVSTRAAR
jgi:hypothetical protein